MIEYIAFADGANVIVDRTNNTVEQRKSFIEIAKSHSVDVHALYLDLPLEVSTNCFIACIVDDDYDILFMTVKRDIHLKTMLVFV